MKRYQKILAVMTMQESDATVLRWAALIATLAKSTKVHCLLSWQSTDVPEPISRNHPWLLEPGEPARQEYASKLAAAELKLPLTCTTAIDVRAGNPLSDALNEATNGGYDLIVVARNPADSSLAEKLARKAPCSVLAIPPDAPAECRGILAAVDFSTYSRAAVDAAAALALATGATLTLFHVFRFDWGHQRARGMGDQLAADLRSHYIGELAKLSVELAGLGINVGTRVSPGALAAHGIANAAQEVGCDLVVIGCRGHNAIYATLLGSTAESILRHSPRPVLAVKAKGTTVGPGWIVSSPPQAD